MDDKVKNYYKNNFLFAGHRMVMPQAGEKFQHSCSQCKYFVKVIGRQETRRVCLARVKAYQNRSKRVPDSIEIVELMLLLGKEALEKLLGEGGQYQMACGAFERKI
ncbi:hypothetical protein [Desulforamulus putei]|uniref:Uncharacterized protein n=1 Tax=Desulforamulus putei DSM 12395 TaxID=1121429 RepID=A0A1M4Y8T0_9FIRM|nr:hypothetical protein [Desulforamulus putei]SHF02214.1 hypothetical protein SAMN02745133_01644 [Desulforamulus putei DSM 12395]